MKVAVGCDHGGFILKRDVLEAVRAAGHEVVDFGVADEQPVDYPDIARRVARAVVAGEAALGVLICGTGIGISIAANKVPGAYCALASDCYSARMARLHNGANLLALGGRTLGPELARELVRVFLTTEPSGEERHQRRRAKIADLERS